MDNLDHFVALVTVLSGESDEFSGSLDHGALFGRASDGDASTTAELEQALVAQLAQCAQNGVAVDAEHSGEVPCWGQALPGFRLAVRDRATDLGRHLIVQPHRLLSVDLDIPHDAS